MEPVDSVPLVTVATGLRLRGAGGKLTALLVPDGIDQLAGRRTVLIGPPGGPVRPHIIEEYRAYGRKLILKLGGIDDAGEAAGLIGQDILLPCNGLVDLPEGAYYIFALVGLQVETRAGRLLGTVRDVVGTGGNPLLVVATAEGERRRGADREILLPAARSICTEIDMAGRRITIDPPEGLLELYGI